MSLLSKEQISLLESKYNIYLDKSSNQLLDKVMIQLRNNLKPLLSSETHTIFQSDTFCQLWIQTPMCCFSKSGKCTVCNYWNGQKIDCIISEAISNCNIPDDCKVLLVNTCGSCLDTNELSISEQNQLLNYLGEQSVDTVILETHLSTLTSDTIIRVMQYLSQKRVLFEFGVESVNPEVLIYSYNKPSSNILIDPYIDKIHQNNAECIANVMIGAPFLTTLQQEEDALNSILSLLDVGVDFITLFPVNIKPNTLPWLLYQNRYYEPVSVWSLIAVLDRIPKEYLNRIDIAWYGEHIEKNVIPPHLCEKCRQRVLSRLSQYNRHNNCDERRKILAEILSNPCSCKDRYYNSKGISFYQQLNRGYSYLSHFLEDYDDKKTDRNPSVYE